MGHHVADNDNGDASLRCGRASFRRAANPGLAGRSGDGSTIPTYDAGEGVSISWVAHSAGRVTVELLSPSGAPEETLLAQRVRGGGVPQSAHLILPRGVGGGGAGGNGGALRTLAWRLEADLDGRVFWSCADIAVAFPERVTLGLPQPQAGPATATPHLSFAGLLHAALDIPSEAGNVPQLPRLLLHITLTPAPAVVENSAESASASAPAPPSPSAPAAAAPPPLSATLFLGGRHVAAGLPFSGSGGAAGDTSAQPQPLWHAAGDYALGGVVDVTEAVVAGGGGGGGGATPPLYLTASCGFAGGVLEAAGAASSPGQPPPRCILQAAILPAAGGYPGEGSPPHSHHPQDLGLRATAPHPPPPAAGGIGSNSPEDASYPAGRATPSGGGGALCLDWARPPPASPGVHHRWAALYSESVASGVVGVAPGTTTTPTEIASGGYANPSQMGPSLRQSHCVTLPAPRGNGSAVLHLRHYVTSDGGSAALDSAPLFLWGSYPPTSSPLLRAAGILEGGAGSDGGSGGTPATLSLARNIPAELTLAAAPRILHFDLRRDTPPEGSPPAAGGGGAGGGGASAAAAAFLQIVVTVKGGGAAAVTAYTPVSEGDFSPCPDYGGLMRAAGEDAAYTSSGNRTHIRRTFSLSGESFALSAPFGEYRRRGLPEGRYCFSIEKSNASSVEPASVAVWVRSGGEDDLHPGAARNLAGHGGVDVTTRDVSPPPHSGGGGTPRNDSLGISFWASRRGGGSTLPGAVHYDVYAIPVYPGKTAPPLPTVPHHLEAAGDYMVHSEEAHMKPYRKRISVEVPAGALAGVSSGACVAYHVVVVVRSPGVGDALQPGRSAVYAPFLLNKGCLAYTPPEDSSSSAGTAVLAVCLAVGGVALLAAAAFWWWRKQSRRPRSGKFDDPVAAAAAASAARSDSGRSSAAGTPGLGGGDLRNVTVEEVVVGVSCPTSVGALQGRGMAHQGVESAGVTSPEMHTQAAEQLGESIDISRGTSGSTEHGSDRSPPLSTPLLDGAADAGATPNSYRSLVRFKDPPQTEVLMRSPMM